MSQNTTGDADLADILAGLKQSQKSISPKFFYDERGSQLFDEITGLAEYYPTRTELKIMRENSAEIAKLVGPQASLIEFGAGSSVKVRILLDCLEQVAAFVPVDISGEHLAAAAAELAADYPVIEIVPVTADFTKPFDLPSPKVMPERNVVFFPGSTIGNFSPEMVVQLLQTMRSVAKDGGALLIGVDLKKSPDILERAYNDEAGVTARFNINMLKHLNDRFGANFDTRAFRHRALYNEEHGRIEMHLVSEKAQSVSIGGEQFDFREGEYLLTECSHRYTLDEFAAVAAPAGFQVHTAWTDTRNLFSVQYCIAV